MRVVAFNAWSVGNRNIVDNLLDLVEDAERPEVVALQEAKEFRGTIRGYRRIAIDTGHRENGNCVLLVRSNVRVVRERVVAVNGPQWVGPKHGIKHPPRVFVGATIETEDGQRWDVLSVHRTPGGPYPHIKVNARSWAQEDRALEDWTRRRVARHPGRPVVLAGDWNNRVLDLRDLSVRHLARRLGGLLRLKGIDGALLVNAKARRAFRLPSLYGSDGHRPVVIDARPKE